MAGPRLFRPNNIPTGLQAYWKLDEASGSRADSSGNGNTLTDNNTVTSLASDYWKTGENCALFTAANFEYLSLTDAAQVGLELNSSNFTVSVFAKPVSFGQQGVIIGKNAASNDGYLVYLPAGDTRVNVYLNASLYQTATGAVAAGRWNHICVVYDKTNSKLMVYVDGKLYPTSASASYFTASDNLAGNATDVQVGKYGSSAAYYDGYMKDLAVWNVALTPLQVKSLALGIDLSSYSYRPDNVSTPPSHYYKLNELSNAAGAVTRVDSALSGGINLTDTNTVTSREGYHETVGAKFVSANTEYLTGSGFTAIGTGDFTYVGWVKFDTLTAQWTLVGRGSTAAGVVITWYNVANQFYVYINGSAFTWSWTPIANTLYHFALKRSGSTLTAYVDGVSLGTNTSSANISATTFWIGTDSGHVAAYMNGMLSDVAEWVGYALTDAEIKSLACGLPIQQTGIVSYFKLDESSNGSGAVSRADSIGSNTLTDNNTTASGTGKVSNAADFERTNSESLSITDGAQSGLDLTTDFTLICWFNPETAASNDLIGKDFNSAGYGLRVNASAQMTLTVAGVNLAGATALSTSAWYHGVGLWDGAGRRVYLNSNQDASSASTTAPSDTAVAFGLGYDPSAAGTYADGLMDEVIVAKRWFRDEEIKAVYNKGLNGKEATSSERNPNTGGFFPFLIAA